MKIVAMKIQTEAGLKKVIACMERTDPEQAQKILENLFEDEFDCTELVFTADCCNFWIPYIRQLDATENAFERGESLLSDWKRFRAFLSRKANVYRPAVEAIDRGVFSLAFENYRQLFDERDNSQKAEIYRKAGLCCKKLGKFEDAQECLTVANNAQPGLPSVLAELADCFALCGHERNAKVLFREAFFIDPAKIDASFLDSELIRVLIEKTAEKGYTGTALLQWIPVYGVLYGVFNVRRELKLQEISKLKQEIYAIETEMKDPSCDSANLTPRLINLYFWLIDHYLMSDDNSKPVNDTLLKIKILDSGIYEQYVK